MWTINTLLKRWGFRAAWSGVPIILDQTSPESISIFHFILELYRSCGGNWLDLAFRTGLAIGQLKRFLDYAAVFLGNIGNYFVSYNLLCIDFHSDLNFSYLGSWRSKVYP
jgi:hypothetical protein